MRETKRIKRRKTRSIKEVKMNKIIRFGIGGIFLFFIGFLFFSVSALSVEGFEVDVPFVKVGIQEGGSLTIPITISNLEDDSKTISLVSQSLGGFVSVSEEEIFIGPNGQETFNVILDGYGKSSGIYAGNIELSSGERILKIPVILEIENDIKFDSRLEIAPGETVRKSEDKLDIVIYIYNLVNASPGVVLTYEIFNPSGEVVFAENESLNVTGEAQFIKEFIIPDDFVEGNYVFGVSAVQGFSRGTSTISFAVQDDVGFSPEITFGGKDYLLFAMFLRILLIILIFLIGRESFRKHNFVRYSWKGRRIKLTDARREIRRLEAKKALLTRAYKGRYVTKTSYTRGINKLNHYIRRLKKFL